MMQEGFQKTTLVNGIRVLSEAMPQTRSAFPKHRFLLLLQMFLQSPNNEDLQSSTGDYMNIFKENLHQDIKKLAIAALFSIW